MAQIMTSNGEMSINDILNTYFGFGGAGGGAGGGAVAGATYGTKQGAALGLAATGAAILGTILGDKAKDKYLPAPGTQGKTEEKTEEVPDVITPGLEGITTDFEKYGKLELPYLPNAKEETLQTTKDKTLQIEKEETLPNIPPVSEVLPNTEIKDETDTNIESEVNPGFDMQSMYDFIMQQQQRQWDREDAIRKEVQEREDNAYTRAVEDMRRAGINPNLVGVNPAQSGGGITQATGLDYTPFKVEAEKELALLEQAIEQGFQGDQKEKDRITELIGNVLRIFSFLTVIKKKG